MNVLWKGPIQLKMNYVSKASKEKMCCILHADHVKF